MPYIVPGSLGDAVKRRKSMPLQEPALQNKESPFAESCCALLQRVVASPRLRRSARMHEFLLYVGRRSLKEGCGQIPEQEIGSEVFGRPSSYDTSVDNIVRVNATDLQTGLLNANGTRGLRGK